MAFLDELRKEAQALKEQEDSLTQARVQDVTQSFLRVQAKLKMIQMYLVELVKNLNLVSIAPARSYFIDGFGVIDDFRPENYVVNTDRFSIDEREFLKTIFLRFACRTEREIVIDKSLHAMIEMQRKYLWQANLKFQCTEFKNAKGLVDRASFKVEREVPVHIKFSADFEQARIFLSLKNFNGLTVNEFAYDADEIDETMLDEFARYLVGKQNNFIGLGHSQQSLMKKVAASRGNDEPSYTKLDPALEARLDAAAEGLPTGGKKSLLGSLKSLISRQ